MKRRRFSPAPRRAWPARPRVSPKPNRASRPRRRPNSRVGGCVLHGTHRTVRWHRRRAAGGSRQPRHARHTAPDRRRHLDIPSRGARRRITGAPGAGGFHGAGTARCGDQRSRRRLAGDDRQRGGPGRSGEPQLPGEVRPADGLGATRRAVRPRAHSGPGAARAGRAWGRGRAPRATELRLRRGRGRRRRACGWCRWASPPMGASRCWPACSEGDRVVLNPPLITSRRNHGARGLARRRRFEMTTGYGLAGRLAAAFIDSKLTPLVIVASLLLGVSRSSRCRARRSRRSSCR